MKQFKMLLALLVWLGALGCSQQEFSEAVVPETVEQQEEATIGTRVSKRLAVQRAKNAVKWISDGPQSRSDLLRVERVEVVGGSALSRAEAADTLFYLVNFSDNQGYALVAADERNTDVYMMSDEGSLDLSELDAASPLAYFMEQAEEYALYEIATFDRIPIIDTTEHMVDPSDTISILFTEIYNGVEYHVKNNYEPVIYDCSLPTRWHQDSPYNNYCFTDGGDQAVAGCVAIAMAQIMAYHQHPATYNWEAMLEDAPYVYLWDAVGSDAVATLVSDIGQAVGMVYGTGGSEAAPSSPISAFRNEFGYDAGNLVAYSYYGIISNLIENNPVYSRGNADDGRGHAWVIDGAKHEIWTKSYYSTETLEFCFTRTMGRVSEYVHNNWGQGMASTFTLSGVFQTNYNREYSTNNQIISYVKPEE